MLLHPQLSSDFIKIELKSPPMFDLIDLFQTKTSFFCKNSKQTAVINITRQRML